MDTSNNYVHVEDPNYIQPEITVTSSSPGDNGEYTIDTTTHKPKRKRKEWVYKSELDALQKKYNLLFRQNQVWQWAAMIGWGALALAIFKILI